MKFKQLTTFIQQIALISKAKEYADIRLRVGDKRVLNELNTLKDRKKSEDASEQPKEHASKIRFRVKCVKKTLLKS